MEKWARSLSKQIALLLGIAAIIIAFVIYKYMGDQFGGLIPMLLLCAFMGACIGFATVMLFKRYYRYDTPGKSAGKKRIINNNSLLF